MSRLTGLARTKSDWNEYSDMLSEEGERHFVRNMEEGGAGLHEAHAFVSEVEAYNRGTLDQSMILEDLVFGFGEEFSSQEAVKKIVQREDDDENDEFDIENLSLRESKAIRLNKFDGRKVYDGLIEKSLITSAYGEPFKFTSLGMKVRAILESEIA